MSPISSPISSLILNGATLAKLSADAAWSRWLLLDVEREGEAFALILRGRDKVLATAKPSTAADPKDAAEHKAALVWNDEAAAARRFVLAISPDEAALHLIAADLRTFYQASPELPKIDKAREAESRAEREAIESNYFTTALAKLGNEAAAILSALIPSFGKTRKSACEVSTLAEMEAAERERAEGKAKRDASAARKAEAEAAQKRAADAEAALAAAMAQIQQLTAALKTGQSGQASPLIDAAALHSMLADIGA